MVVFYIVRHGTTELNEKGKLQGQIDSPLTDKGYKDAFYLAKKLEKNKFDAVFASDLGRAFITAHIISDKLKLTNKLFRDKQFREIDFGDLTARYRDEVKLEYDKIKDNCDVIAPSGESYLDVKKRVIKDLFLLSKKKYKKMLIVTHSGCIRAIMSEALSQDLNLLLKRKISHKFIAKFEIVNKKIINFQVLNE